MYTLIYKFPKINMFLYIHIKFLCGNKIFICVRWGSNASLVGKHYRTSPIKVVCDDINNYIFNFL